MPELPEVETVVRGLKKEMQGKPIHSLVLLTPSIITGNSNRVTRALIGQKISTVSRVGKMIFFELENGILTSHLRMTGKFGKVPVANHQFVRHDHLSFVIDDYQLVYNDVRRFGRFVWYPGSKSVLELGIKIGIDVLTHEFTLEYLSSVLSKSHKPLKSLLLDQTKIAGIGNIYADEICFAAGILPQTEATTLTLSQIHKLHSNCTTILRKAIEYEGSSISDYTSIYGVKGRFVSQHMVYGRAHKPCLVCGQNLVKITLAGRTTVFCPIDQV